MGSRRCPATLFGQIHEGRRAAEYLIGHDQIDGIDVLCGDTVGAQYGRQHGRAKAFAQPADHVQPAFGQFTQDGDAAAQAVELLQAFVEKMPQVARSVPSSISWPATNWCLMRSVFSAS